MKNNFFVYFLIIFTIVIHINCGFAAQGTIQNLVDENWQFTYNKTLENRSNEDIKDAINKELCEYLPGAKVLSFKEIKQNDEILYKCSASYQGAVIDLLINPKTSAVSGGLQNKPEANMGEDGPTDTYIDKNLIKEGTKEINEILKQVMPEASIDRVKFNKKDNTVDGYVLYQNFKYYFKIDALNGRILKMEPVK